VAELTEELAGETALALVGRAIGAAGRAEELIASDDAAEKMFAVIVALRELRSALASVRLTADVITQVGRDRYEAGHAAGRAEILAMTRSAAVTRPVKILHLV
jgi:hypothetical protein